MVSVLTLFLVGVCDTEAQSHTLRSLSSVPDYIGGDLPTINNRGEVAYLRFMGVSHGQPHWVVFVHDGNVERPVFDATAAGFSGWGSRTVVINDAGVLVFHAYQWDSSACNGYMSGGCLVRVDETGIPEVLATFDYHGGGDFLSLLSSFAVNSSGQVAITVLHYDERIEVVRIDGPGQFTLIATQSDDFHGFGYPALDDSGTVAFAATADGWPGVFTGKGGALEPQGTRPTGFGWGGAVTINREGTVIDSGVSAPALIYTAREGAVNTLVVGDEDPIFGLIHVQPSINDNGAFVFGSTSYDGEAFGLFAGRDPERHAVVRRGDSMFGGIVSRGLYHALRVSPTGGHYFNNRRQIVFEVTVSHEDGTATSHIVLAEPVGVDQEAPATSIGLTPSTATGQSEWYVSPVQVTVSAADGPDGSGVAETRCGVFPHGTAPGTFEGLTAGCALLEPGADLGADGVHEVVAASRDVAGNVELPVATRTIRIDRTAPQITCNPAPTFQLHATEAFVTGRATDALSGPMSWELSVAADTSSPGQKAATLAATDVAGNAAAVMCAYTVVEPNPPPPSCAQNVTNTVTMSLAKVTLNRKTGRYTQKVTLSGGSKAPIAGPFAFVLDGLNGAVSLLGPAGTTACASPAGSPYLEVPVGSDGVLSWREKTSIVLEFVNPTAGPISYTPRVLAGSGTR